MIATKVRAKQVDGWEEWPRRWGSAVYNVLSTGEDARENTVADNVVVSGVWGWRMEDGGAS